MSSELETAPLFAELPEEELRELEQVLRPLDLQPGETLFRQGDDASGLYVLTAGSVGVYSRLPGEREVELAVLGAGQVIGELALVDGGTRAATVRALEETSALFFGRVDFHALVSRMDPAGFTIKRRLTSIVCERLRRRLGILAESLGDGAAGGDVHGDSVSATAPDEHYLVRLPFFRAFAPLHLPELVSACRTVQVPARSVLLEEGAHPDVAYVTLNGAVEEMLGHGERRIRVRLAGPGQATGYLGLLDGGPSPVTVATRERALLLAVHRATFGELLNGATALSYAFVEAVQRDLIAALRQAERPQARLAAGQQEARRGGRSSGTSASVTSRNERANSTNR